MKPRTEGCRADSYSLTFSGTNLRLKKWFSNSTKKWFVLLLLLVVFQFGPMSINDAYAEPLTMCLTINFMLVVSPKTFDGCQ